MKLSEVSAQLELKKKSLKKTEETLKTMDAEFKKIATKQQTAEQNAKKEKDPIKKKKFEDESNKARAEGEAYLKKRDAVRQSVPALEKSIDDLTKQQKLMLEGIAAYGKARTDYLLWFKGEKTKMEKELAEAKKYMLAAEAESAKTEKLLGKGEPVKAAEAAGAAAKMAEFAKDAFGKVDVLYKSWNPKWDEQRNLAPKDYNVTAPDIQCHAAVTAKVYETFKYGDDSKTAAYDYVEKAETAAEEAELILQAGGKTLDAYKKMLAKTELLVKAKIGEYESYLTQGWGISMMDDGARFKKEKGLIKKDDPTTVARALKVAEQGANIIPKTLANCELRIKQANDLVTKERSRIPKDYQRELKAEIDKLGMMIITWINKHKANKVKIDKSLEALKELAAAAKG